MKPEHNQRKNFKEKVEAFKARLESAKDTVVEKEQRKFQDERIDLKSTPPDSMSDS